MANLASRFVEASFLARAVVLLRNQLEQLRNDVSFWESNLMVGQITLSTLFNPPGCA